MAGIKSSDWIIDLGPEGGEGGGTIVAEGTPEHVVQCERCDSPPDSVVAGCPKRM